MNIPNLTLERGVDTPQNGYIDRDRVFKILLVDDERNVLIALHNTLKRTKLFKSEIRIAEDGEMAWSEI